MGCPPAKEAVPLNLVDVAVMSKLEALSIVGVPDPITLSVDPSKVRFCSAFKLVPVPPVITLLSALLLIVAEPDEPCSPF